jgi:hypothetical protein
MLPSCGYGVVIIAGLVLDRVPRFFQGDSLSYLMTGTGWIPPDRSWAFGFVVSFLLRYTHGYAAFVLIQIGVLVCLIAAARLFFSETGRPTVVYGAIAVLLALDPLLEIYTRFFMSDFLAMAAYFAALVGLCIVGRGPGARGLWHATGLVVVATIVAIFLRIAYVPIVALTVLLFAVILWDRLGRRQRLALGLAALGPLLAVGSLMVANWFVFADRYPGELFVNKLSGVLLAGTYAPALQPEDFDHAGIPITNAEFRRLKLANYDKRLGQVWGSSSDDLHQLIKNKLGITDGYTTAVDETARRLVWSAAMRDPAAVAQVYVHNALLFAQPSEWRRKLNAEMGLSRSLPPDFVAYSNRYAAEIVPWITALWSPLLHLYAAVCRFYPLQLLLGTFAAAYLLLRDRRAASAVLVAGLVAVLAAAPLYSIEMLARYVLGAVVISYLLIGLAIQSLMALMRHHGTATPAGIGTGRRDDGRLGVR